MAKILCKIESWNVGLILFATRGMLCGVHLLNCFGPSSQESIEAETSKGSDVLKKQFSNVSEKLKEVRSICLSVCLSVSLSLSLTHSLSLSLSLSPLTVSLPLEETLTGFLLSLG